MECKGKIYRARVNKFVNSKGEYIYQERMIPLKRKSCSGCDACAFLDEQLHESISNDISIIIKDIKHDALYSLEITNTYRDYITGMLEDWDLEFIKCDGE